MDQSPAQSGQTVEDLGKLVKQKYPDAYGSLPDVEVGQKVKAKYPQYSQFSDVPSVSRGGPWKSEEERERAVTAKTKSGYQPGVQNLPSNAPPEDVEAFNQYRKYRFDHRGDGGQGMDELGGAMMLGIAKPIFMAGEGLVMKAIGQSIKTGVRGVVGGTAAAVGTHKLAKEAGLPEWAASGASFVAGLYGAKAAADFPAFVQETGSISPGKFVQWMLSKGKKITPLAPGKGTGTKYGGPAETRYSPPNPIPRGRFTPPETAPAKFEPFRPSASTARKMQFGGTAKTEYGSVTSGARSGVNRALRPPSSEETQAAASTATEGSAAPPKRGKLEAPAMATRRETQAAVGSEIGGRVRAPFTRSAAARGPVARNVSIAQSAHDVGLTSDVARTWPPSKWAEAAKSLGAPRPNAASIKQIIAEIERLERIKK